MVDRPLPRGSTKWATLVNSRRVLRPPRLNKCAGRGTEILHAWSFHNRPSPGYRSDDLGCASV